MTRINIIDPSELYDQHLVAEYREIFMVVPSLRRSLNRKTPFKKSEIPNTYTLNRGHVKFFYNKLEYLQKRYQSLITEMKRRGMNPDAKRTFPDISDLPEWTKGDWSPTLEEQKIVRARIEKRIAEKPNWYRKTSTT